MNDKDFNAILRNSGMTHFEISGNSGTKKFAAHRQDSDFIQSSPSLEDLQKKFLGKDSDENAKPVVINQHDRSTSVDDDDDVDMRIVRIKGEDEGSDSINLDERTVIASKNEGLLGEQG